MDYKLITANINQLLARHELYPVDLAELIGMNKRRFSAKRKAPWTFTLEEIEKMAEALHIDSYTLMHGDVLPRVEAKA